MKTDSVGKHHDGGHLLLKIDRLPWVCSGEFGARKGEQIFTCAA